MFYEKMYIYIKNINKTLKNEHKVIVYEYSKVFFIKVEDAANSFKTCLKSIKIKF